MNSRFTSLILAVVLVGCAAATLAYLSRDGPSRPATTVLSPGAAERLQRLEDSLEALSAKADTMAHQLVPGIHTSVCFRQV